jgi:threonine/homoserine/homoserine lactone efflux protein
MSSLLPGFLLGFVGSIPLAGPVSILVFGRGLHGYFRSGRAIAVGAAVAEAGYAALACWGLGTLVERFPRIALAARAGGAALLVVLGGWFLLHRPAPRKPDGARDGGVRRGLSLGFGLSALNPTLLATWSAAAAMAHGAGLVDAGPAAAGLFGVGVGAGIVAWFWAMLALLRRHHGRFRPELLDRVVQGLGAGDHQHRAQALDDAVLVVSGVWVAVALVD